MHLFSKYSEEGNVDGLNWVEASVKRFDFSNSRLSLKVPHMGWNSIIIKKDSALLNNVIDGGLFYFAHSYYVICDSSTDVLCCTTYGIEFHAAIQRGNIYGLQFHPEKSHAAGMEIIRNFCFL